MKFKDFFKLDELWGDIPVQGKKPSDGLVNSKNLSMSDNSTMTNGPAPKMMKKKMKKQ